MTRTQETIATALITIITITGALRMYAPQPYLWTIVWSVCFTTGSLLLFMHFTAALFDHD